MTDPTPDEFKRRTVVDWRDGQIFVYADDSPNMPPVTLSVFISNGHISAHLTADEAALLGKTLLEAATGVIGRDERPAPVTYTDGSTDDLSRSLDVIADSLAAKAVEG